MRLDIIGVAVILTMAIFVVYRDHMNLKDRVDELERKLEDKDEN